MELFVDDQAVEHEFVEEATSLEDALRHVQEHHCGDDHVVVGVLCDGEEVPSDQFADALNKPARSFERLDVITDGKTRLVLDAMQQASNCLVQTSEACKQTAELLTEGRTGDATNTLRDCLQVWQQIHDAVAKSVTMLGIDPEVFTVNDATLMEAIGRPKAVLLQVRDALVARDFVLLADLLQYEFDDIMSGWQAIVDALIEQADRSQ